MTFSKFISRKHRRGYPHHLQKAVGTESNPDAPVYVKMVGFIAPSAEAEVELTLPAGAHTVLRMCGEMG